jgi:hypothetical protein
VIRTWLIATRVGVAGDGRELLRNNRFNADCVKRFDKRSGDEDMVDEFLAPLVYS